MTGRRLLVLVVATIASALVGCGGGGDGDGDGDAAGTATFEDDRFEVTFDYPDDFALGEVTDSRSAGGSSTASRGSGSTTTMPSF